MKMLRVDDDVHQIITDLAEADDRGLTAYLNRHFRNLGNTAPPLHDRQVLTAEDGSTATVKNISSALALPFVAVGNGEKPAPEIKKILEQTGAKFCKAGHLLAPNSNRCLQKGCKYA